MGFALDHGMPRGAFTILDRDAGPAGRFRWLKAGTLEGASQVFVDGKLAAEIAASAFEDGGEDKPQIFVDQKIIVAIIGATLNAQRLAFDASAKPEETISLQGFKAAMLYIDEQQGRVGTQTAIVARGDKHASAVPAGKPVPLLSLKDMSKGNAAGESIEKAVIAFHKQFADRKECSNISEGEPTALGSAALDRAGWIVEVDCWRAAYQAGTVLYTVAHEKNRASVRHAMIEKLDTRTGQLSISSRQSLSNLDFDTAAQISAFHKGRGIGDCGTAESWRWDGKVFRLAHFSIMVACGIEVEDNWITLWRTREK